MGRGIFTINTMRRKNKPIKRQGEKLGLEYSGLTKWYPNEPLRKNLRDKEKYLDEIKNIERNLECC